jgi:hypothetical protein
MATRAKLNDFERQALQRMFGSEPVPEAAIEAVEGVKGYLQEVTSQDVPAAVLALAAHLAAPLPKPKREKIGAKSSAKT